MKNEVITFGKGYSMNDGIKVIVQSVKNVDAQLTVIGVDLDERAIKFITKNNGTYIDGRELAEKHNIDLNLSPYTLKIIFYALYCQKYCKSDNVFICDFTDICFQKDVFELVTDKVTVHSENKQIATCDVNTTWLKICYGDEVYNKIKSNNILNSGTYFGRRSDIIDLLNRMCDSIVRVLNRVGNYLIIDQAAMNVVVYDDPDSFNIREDNMVYNLAHSAKDSFSVEDKRVSVNGIQPYVLHQYDVMPKLKEFLYNR